MKALTIIWRFAKHWLPEAFVVFALVFTLNNYVGHNENIINADGVGYYDYLPSALIHGDLHRKNATEAELPEPYARVVEKGVYVRLDDYRVNKYPCGTAVLQLPFFLAARASVSGEVMTGYEPPFHRAVYYAALFYLFLSLLFVRGFLRSYGISNRVILAVQLLMVLATNITWYAGADASFSHVYSLFAVAGFAHFARQWFVSRSASGFLWACVSLGLIIILRQINVLVVLALPLLAGSLSALRDGVKAVIFKPRLLIAGACAGAVVIMIQLSAWYLQTGRWVVYSYQGEGFDFSKPEFISILFSFHKGLFIYTPVLLLSLVGLVVMLARRQWFLSFSWLGFFVSLTYVLSSWWSWTYGASYGHRAFIEFFPLLFLPIAMALSQSGRVISTGILGVGLLCIPLNVIQTYQYRTFILHWDGMNKEKYFKVFLRKDDTFKGLVWKTRASLIEMHQLGEIHMGELTATSESIGVSHRDLSEFLTDESRVRVISMTLSHDFPDTETARLVFSMQDSSQTLFWDSKPLLHFMEGRFGIPQTGWFDYQFPQPLTAKGKSALKIELVTTDERLTIRDIRIRFYGD